MRRRRPPARRCHPRRDGFRWGRMSDRTREGRRPAPRAGWKGQAFVRRGASSTSAAAILRLRVGREAGEGHRAPSPAAARAASSTSARQGPSPTTRARHRGSDRAGRPAPARGARRPLLGEPAHEEQGRHARRGRSVGGRLDGDAVGITVSGGGAASGLGLSPGHPPTTIMRAMRRLAHRRVVSSGAGGELGAGWSVIDGCPRAAAGSSPRKANGSTKFQCRTPGRWRRTAPGSARRARPASTRVSGATAASRSPSRVAARVGDEHDGADLDPGRTRPAPSSSRWRSAPPNGPWELRGRAGPTAPLPGPDLGPPAWSGSSAPTVAAGSSSSRGSSRSPSPSPSPAVGPLDRRHEPPPPPVAAVPAVPSIVGDAHDHRVAAREPGGDRRPAGHPVRPPTTTQPPAPSSERHVASGEPSAGGPPRPTRRRPPKRPPEVVPVQRAGRQQRDGVGDQPGAPAARRAAGATPAPARPPSPARPAPAPPAATARPRRGGGGWSAPGP